MKISFSQGKKIMVPMVGREVAQLCGLWSDSPVAPHHPVGSLAWGASLWGDPGRGCRGFMGASTACGADHSAPTLLLSGERCSLLTLVLFPVQLPRPLVIPFWGAVL